MGRGRVGAAVELDAARVLGAAGLEVGGGFGVPLMGVRGATVPTLGAQPKTIAASRSKSKEFGLCVTRSL